MAGSHLVNDGPVWRFAYLATASRHLARGAHLLVEAYPPDTDWPASVGTPRIVGPVRITVTGATVTGTHLAASVRYETPGGTWDQPFEAELLDDAALQAALADAGFAFHRWLDRRRGWLVARRA